MDKATGKYIEHMGFLDYTYELIHPDVLDEIDHDIQNAIFSLYFVLCKEELSNKQKIGLEILGKDKYQNGESYLDHRLKCLMDYVMMKNKQKFDLKKKKLKPLPIEELKEQMESKKIKQASDQVVFSH